MMTDDAVRKLAIGLIMEVVGAPQSMPTLPGEAVDLARLAGLLVTYSAWLTKGYGELEDINMPTELWAAWFVEKAMDGCTVPGVVSFGVPDSLEGMEV